MPFNAIIFDLDDTLYPERSYTMSGFRAVGDWSESHVGVPAHECFSELCAIFEQGHRRDTFDRWLASRSLEPDGRVEHMMAVFRSHDPDIALDDSVAALLRRLRDRHSLALVTDGYLEVQRKKVSALGIEPYFDVIVFSDELGRDAWKPSRRPFEAALERLGVQAIEAVYVADNPAKDFFGARGAGLATVRVRHDDGVYGHLEADSPEWAADAEIGDLSELEAALESLGAAQEVGS